MYCFYSYKKKTLKNKGVLSWQCNFSMLVEYRDSYYPVKHLLLLIAVIHQLLLVRGNCIAPGSLSSSSLQHLPAFQWHSISKMMTHARARTQVFYLLSFNYLYFQPTADTHSNNHILGIVISGNCTAFETAVSSIFLSNLLYLQHTYCSSQIWQRFYLTETSTLLTPTHFCSYFING